MIIRTVALGILITSFFYVQKYNTYEYEKWGIIPLTTLKPAWERKIPTAQELKIGLITDTQLHPNRINRQNKADDAPRRLKDKDKAIFDTFVTYMESFAPDVIILPGDIIEGTNDDAFVGAAGLKLVQQSLARITAPALWAIGNHELRSVTKQQYLDALDINYLNKSFVFGDYKIIIVDSNFDALDHDAAPGNSFTRGSVSEANLAWLEEELQTNLNTIVAMHHPPFVAGDGVPQKEATGLLNKAERVQALLEKYNATAAMGGHLERKFHMKKNGVHYYVFPGTRKSPDFLKAFYQITIRDGEISTLMRYQNAQTNQFVEEIFEETPHATGRSAKEAEMKKS